MRPEVVEELDLYVKCRNFNQQSPGVIELKEKLAILEKEVPNDARLLVALASMLNAFDACKKLTPMLLVHTNKERKEEEGSMIEKEFNFLSMWLVLRQGFHTQDEAKEFLKSLIKEYSHKISKHHLVQK